MVTSGCTGILRLARAFTRASLRMTACRFLSNYWESASEEEQFLFLPLHLATAKVRHPLLFHFVALSQLEVYMAKIVGIEGMNPQQLVHELQGGAKFVQYQFCFSVLIMTFKQGTNAYFLRAGESTTVKGLRWSLLTLLVGWWGIPWGPIIPSSQCGRTCAAAMM